MGQLWGAPPTSPPVRTRAGARGGGDRTRQSCFCCGGGAGISMTAHMAKVCVRIRQNHSMASQPGWFTRDKRGAWGCVDNAADSPPARPSPRRRRPARRSRREPRRTRPPPSILATRDVIDWRLDYRISASSGSS